MPIYTRTGDSGMTGLYGGKRISKADCQIETYGSIDELTSFIGLTTTKVKDKKNIVLLINIQKDLHQIMGYLSGAKTDLKFLEKRVLIFEKTMDTIEAQLPKLTKFILPGGNEPSAWFQILRVICRKVERRIIDYFNSKDISSDQLLVVKYFNRLSDLFFDLARQYGKNSEVVL